MTELIQVSSRYSVRVTPKKEITVVSHDTGKENTFKIGDMAEYDSYNLSYYGAIQSITEKTVTIKEQYCDTKHRLKLETFAWRNYDFNLAKTQEENYETSHYI